MNKTLFQPQSSVPAANAVNDAGGKAYKMPEKAALAQYAVTGVFNNTFYVNAQDQLSRVAELCNGVPNEFIAKLAIYSRQVAFMKDVPAYLLAYLAKNDIDLLTRVFDRVVDDGRMLRGFVQIIRSGVVGRKSLGTRPRNLVRNWLNNRKLDALIFDSVGNDPSLADVIKLSHVKANSPERQEMFKYLCGNEIRKELLPQNVQDLIAYQEKLSQKVPNVPFQMLTALNLGTKEWTEIARNASWTMTRMNLNTFLRHGVFNDKAMVDLVAQRLRNPDLIQRARVFPYQLFVAYQATSTDYAMSRAITEALQDAMEIATLNVPVFEGKRIAVFADASGSMQHAVTGTREGATSKARCIDVASLVTSSVLRTNPDAIVIPFTGQSIDLRLNPRDSVMTNTQKLVAVSGGSTYCPAPLKTIMDRGEKVDVVIYVSDNESWMNGTGGYGDRKKKGTELAELWRKYRAPFNRDAKMVCLDVNPGNTWQALDDNTVLNLGGFSDNIWPVITGFVNGGGGHFVNEIEKVQL